MENKVKEITGGLEDTADGAFIVDCNLRIHWWNNSAKKILGFNSKDTEGNLCYQILRGLNEDSSVLCKAHCQILRKVLNSKPVSSYDLLTKTKKGESRWLNMSIVTLNNGQNKENKMILHLFRDISEKKDDEVFFRQFMEIASKYQNSSPETEDDSDGKFLLEELTIRQAEVLNLLARGLGTKEIAETLSISPNTVRNHVQNILQKLQVNSRLEAVTYAFEIGCSLPQSRGIIDSI